MKLEPVAWALYWKEGDLCDIVTAQRLADAWLKRMDDATITPRPHIAPLYATPEGHVVVPVEPTEAMIDAGVCCAMPYGSSFKENEDCIAVYKAMIAAKEQQ